MTTSHDQKAIKRGVVESSALEDLVESSVNKRPNGANGDAGNSSRDHSAAHALAESLTQDTGNRVPQNPDAAVSTFFDLVINELSALRTRSEIEAIQRAADVILASEAKGGRVHVTGIGKSEHIARYVASLLSSTGTPAYFLHATECIHGSAGQVCPNDVAIAISNSGTTPELLTAIETLREFGTKIIAVSGNRDSDLAKTADVLLDAGVDNEGGELNLVPRASILGKIYVLCALSVALEAHKGLTREQYARWHPGGALGRLARGE
jgi:arabinose-5-phosphate isomerase